MIVEYECAHCGKHVRKHRSPANRGHRARFCSQKCNGAARRGTGRGPTPNHTFTCENCGVERSVYRAPSARPPRFCSIACIGAAQSGSGNPAYKGAAAVKAGGYVQILVPGRGYVYEHRLVMEAHIGRRLRTEEVVHHRNRDRADNRIENLELFSSHAAHLRARHPIKEAMCSTTT